MVFAGAVAAASCGGGGGSNPPAGPSPSPGGGSTASVTINIQGINGKSSFNPNPASVPAGGTVVFKNNDTANTHHIVLDDGSMQTADIPPGGTSASLPLGGLNKAFHCSNHPTMVGSLNAAATPDPPPCNFNYC